MGAKGSYLVGCLEGEGAPWEGGSAQYHAKVFSEKKCTFALILHCFDSFMNAFHTLIYRNRKTPELLVGFGWKYIKSESEVKT